MKKLLSLILSVVMLLSCFAFQTVIAADDIKVIINGQNLTMDQPPVLVNDRTLVPVRAIFEALGATVSWNNDTNTATGVLGETTVEIQIENTTAKVNGKDVILDVPAKLISDRTLVPVRFISESLGAKVSWDDPSQTVIITTSSGGKTLTFDTLDSAVAGVDYTDGGGYGTKNISLSSEQDHTTGSGMSLKLSGRTEYHHRLKFIDAFDALHLGSTYNVSLWVYVPDTDTVITLGAYGASGTEHSASAVLTKAYNVKANEWTNLQFEYKHTKDSVTQLGIDQMDKKAPLASVIYVDDLNITSGGASMTTEKNDYEVKNISVPGHRPVPTQFSTSNSYDDLIFYKEITPPDQLLKKLPEGTPVITNNDFVNSGLMGENYGSIEVINVDSMPFDKAIRATVNEVPSTSYGIQIKNYFANSVEEGDILLLTVYMRTVSGGVSETQAGQVQLIVESTQTDQKLLQANISAGPEWKVAYFPLEVQKGYEGKVCWAPIRLGFYKQVVDIGGYTITNYGKNVKLDDMPASVGYVGMEKDAQWRKEAFERIDKIRKGDMSIVVKDANGNVIPDANVKVDMTESEFQLGTALGSNIMNENELNKKMRESIVSLFNGGVFETESKWAAWERADQKKVKNTIKWLKDNGVTNLRGHCLMWDSTGYTEGNSTMPADIPGILDDKDALDKRVKEHITSIVKEFENDFVDWDVVNELTAIFGKNVGMYTSRYGNGVILDWFKWAYEASPETPLYINETRITGDNSTLDYFCPILDFLNQNNVKWDGIGVQGHFGTTCDPTRFYDELERLASYGKDIRITEFDVNIQDDELNASFTRDILITMFSHESVKGIIMWGFYDGAHWFKNAPIYDKDWNIKKSGEQFIDLFYNKFWTRESGKTNADGSYNLRGFYGDYDVTAEKDGKTKTVSARFYKGDNGTIEIVLD